MRQLYLSAARNVMVFMTQSADHVTGLTGATLTLTASKDGAAFASISPTVTERGNGWYNVALTSSHTDTLGDFVLRATAASADPTDLVCQVVSALLTVGSIQSGLATAAGVAAIPTNPLLTTDVRLDNLDATISSRLSTAGYTTPPTAAAIRTEIDANSTKLDVAVSTRLATAGYTTPPTVAAIRSEMDANSTKLDVAVGTRLATAGYTAPDNATIATIQSDTNDLQTQIGVAGAGLTALGDTRLANLNATVSSRLATAGYTAPDNAGIAAIQAKTDALTIAGGLVDVDVKKMNGATVNGDGTAGNLWRGA